MFYLVNSIFPNHFSITFKDDFLYTFLEYYLQFIMFSIVFALYKKAINNGNLLRLNQQKLHETEKLNLQLQLQNQELDKQRIEANYNFLRTQINPHFLYNTLGYFYAKVVEYDEKTAEGLNMLTNLMRYSLNNGDAMGRVPLAEEITNLNNYLGLQQLRYGDQLQLIYNNDIEDLGNYKILPHFMLTLVENAFKHGNNSDPKKPLTITIRFENETLYFTVKNFINTAKKAQLSTNTGLANLINRLKSVYKDKHVYNVSNDDTTYEVYMQVSLNTAEDMFEDEEYENSSDFINLIPAKTNTGFNFAAML
jgi:two-component system, LytTR family, sensor kinase